MSMSLWINGTQITDFILSTPFKDTIDEELDALNFQIKSDTRLSYKKFDRVVYMINHDHLHQVLRKVMAVFNIVESWKGEKWVYQVSCLSPTKILENIIINGMAETYPVNNGLYGQMERVRTKINAQLSVEMAVYPEIIFNSTIASSGDDSIVKDISSVSDFLWDGQVNAREIFNDMLDKADAICVATNFTIDLNNNITQIEIGAVKREKVGREIVNSVNDIENGGLDSVKQVVKGITYNRNSEFACGNIISLIKNGIAKDNVNQAYLPARNTDLTIDDEADWHIITQEPIYSLNKVIILMPIQVGYYKWHYDSSQEEWVRQSVELLYGETILLPIDITSYVVEKDVFDNMSIAQQKKCLYFKRGEKGIYGLYKRYKQNPLWSNTALQNIMEDLSTTTINAYNNANDVIDWRSVGSPDLLMLSGGDIEKYNGSGIISGNGEIVENAIQSFVGVVTPSGSVAHNNMYDFIGNASWFKKALFSVNYQPYCDSVVKIEKTNASNIEANAKNLSVLKNQSDRTIDASKYYDSQKSLIERMGNKEMFLDAMIDISGQYNSTLTLWDLGDYFTLNSKKWTITQREIENYNMGKLKVRYTLSKEYNASNIDIQVNRDKRLYGIPLSQYVDRYIIIKNSYAPYIDKLAIESWDDFTLPHDTNETYQKGFNILEMIKIGNATITDRVARCYDNFAVDIERTKYSSTIVNVYTRYCDTDGYKTTIKLYGFNNTFYNSLACSDYSRLPFKPYADGGSNIETYTYKMQLTNINKDKMERLIFIIKN